MSWLALTLLGILVFSPKSLLYRVLMKDEQSDPYAQSVVFFGLGGTLALLFSLFHRGFQYQLTSRQLLLFLPLTVCATVGPVLLFKAYQRLDASEIAILQSSQKLWAVLGAFLFLREPFSVNKTLGTVLVVAGIAMTLWRGRKFQVNEGVAQIVPLAGLITINSVLLGIVFLKERTNIPNGVIGALVTVAGATLVL